MLGGGMTDGGIGVGASPGKARGAIDDEVACPDQPTPDGGQHTEDEERLGHRRSSGLSTLALLGRTGNAWLPITAHGQAAGQGKCGPSH
jgi:hypothetical protein